jgi:hypothetical protein
MEGRIQKTLDLRPAGPYVHIFNTVSSSALTIYKCVANTGQMTTVVVKTTSVESTTVAFERRSPFSPYKVMLPNDDFRKPKNISDRRFEHFCEGLSTRVWATVI